MENYASHGLYVKFSDDEARALEERSLQLAMQESKADEEAKRYFRLEESHFQALHDLLKKPTTWSDVAFMKL